MRLPSRRSRCAARRSSLMREKRRGNADSSSARRPIPTTVRTRLGAPPTNSDTGPATPTDSADGSAPPSGSSAAQNARNARSSGARRPVAPLQVGLRRSSGAEITQQNTATATRAPSTMKFRR